MVQPVTPRGFRDVLPQEAAERAVIANALSGVFDAWSYGRVETPVAEEYEVLAAGTGSSLEGRAFRLFDTDGSLLSLRPEMTVPIARLVSSRLRDTPGPHRLSYVADVFREHVSLRGQARQFTQAGVELVGAAGPAADAEVLTMLAESLDATGPLRYTIALGTVAVLRALLEASGGDARWRSAVLVAAHERNLVEIDRLAVSGGIEPVVAEAIRVVPRIRGGVEAIERCRAVAGECGCTEALDELGTLWELLESTGAAARVTVDFGVMRSFDYYTGVVFEVLAPGLGLAIGGGGRYDAVLSVYGTPAPAAGFALGIERLHIALAEQGVRIPVRELDTLVCGAVPAEVFAGAARLRAAGLRVRIAPGLSALDAVCVARAAGAREVVLAEGGELVRLDADGACAEVLPAPPGIPAPDGGAR